MAWIEAHQKLDNHPKVLDLMNYMTWDLDTTIGKLFRFWWWCVDYAEDGDLRKHNDARIASAVGLNGCYGKEFVENMVKSGWIDRNPYFRVHDWWDYIGKFLQIKYKQNPDKWRHVQNCYLNGSMNVIHNTTKPTIPNQHNQTKQDLNVLIQQNEVLLSQFDSIKRERIEMYLKMIALKNKSKTISPGRINTLLLELVNSRSRCNNDAIFMQGVEASIDRDACCIGYINAVIKNKKTEKPR